MSEKYYMSSIQKRLYVVCSMKIDDVSYNTPKIFKIDGKVDIGKLQRAFEKLARRYELLRTTFENDGESFIKWYMRKYIAMSRNINLIKIFRLS
jgi:hypothetical protein